MEGRGDQLPVLPIRDGAEGDGATDIRVRLVALNGGTGETGWAVERRSPKAEQRASTFTTQGHPFEHFLDRAEHLRDVEIIPNREVGGPVKQPYKDQQLEEALDYLRGQIKMAARVPAKKAG